MNKRASLTENNPLSKVFKRTGPRSKKPIPNTEMNKKQSGPQQQTTVILTKNQMDWLDGISFDSRKGGGKVISKSELFREMVNILWEKSLNLRGLKTGEDIRERLTDTIQSK